MDYDDFGWEDMATAGSLAEEIADEELERLLLERELLQDVFGDDIED